MQWPSASERLHGDDDASLRAALSVIDDWDFDFGFLFESDVVCDSSPTNASDVAATRPHIPVAAAPDITTSTKCSKRSVAGAPYTGRNKRKLEIQHLREQSAELQRQLERAAKIAEAAAETSPRDQSVESKHLAVAWEEIAERQRSEREAVEDANDSLRASLAVQAKIARQLLTTSRRVRVEKGLLPMTSLDALDFDWQRLSAAEHLSQLDKMYARMERVFDKPCYSSGRREFQDIHVREDTTKGYLVEFDIAVVLPFDVDLVAEALWYHTVRMTSGERVYQFKDVDVQPSSLVSLFAGVSNGKSFESSMHGQIATRRHTRETIRELVSKVFTDIVMDSAPPFEMRGDGWLRCVPIHNGVERVGSEGVTSPLTQVHWYRRLQIKWGADIPKSIGVLAPDEIAARVRETVSWNLQSVENRLLVQGRRVRKQGMVTMFGSDESVAK